MYVLVANGYKGIVESKQVLDILTSIYPYPKFRKVHSREDAISFLTRYNRRDVPVAHYNYGDTDSKSGYASIFYAIDKSSLYFTIDTSKVGFIRIKSPNTRDIVVDNRPAMIRVKISNINLNEELISDNCLAITTILRLLGDYVDVNICVPDISIYLAMKKYFGHSYLVQEVQNTIQDRLGGVAITIATDKGD